MKDFVVKNCTKNFKNLSYSMSDNRLEEVIVKIYLNNQFSSISEMNTNDDWFRLQSLKAVKDFIVEHCINTPQEDDDDDDEKEENGFVLRRITYKKEGFDVDFTLNQNNMKKKLFIQKEITIYLINNVKATNNTNHNVNATNNTNHNVNAPNNITNNTNHNVNATNNINNDDDDSTVWWCHRSYKKRCLYNVQLTGLPFQIKEDFIGDKNQERTFNGICGFCSNLNATLPVKKQNWKQKGIIYLILYYFLMTQFNNK